MTPTTDALRRRVLALMAAAAALPLAACGGGSDAPSPSPSAATPPAPTPPSPTPPAPTPPAPTPPAPTPPAPTPPAPAPAGKSWKRGIAYDLKDTADLGALSPGVSWWYNWSPRTTVTTATSTSLAMDFVPMLWNGNFDDAAIIASLKASPAVKYLLLLNEPNLTDQSNLSPSAAAALWPRYEAIATATGVQLVGPAITWGTMTGFADPVAWLDAFIAAYKAANGNRAPRIDALAFHWYDYGLAAQLDRLLKYGKPFWVTEFANWHSQNDGAQIDSVAKQKVQMADMVNTCESRADVIRYAWFTGRWDDASRHTNLLDATGQLSELGAHYIGLKYVAS